MQRIGIWLGFAILVLAGAVSAPADIFRWDNGEVIPGTEEITPGPGIFLYQRDVQYADLANSDLRYGQFEEARLDYARFTNSNLSGGFMPNTTFLGADFTDAIIDGRGCME